LNHIGPKFVVDFKEVVEPEERAHIMRDAYERVQALSVFINKNSKEN
jgi:hypothetical protein